VGGVQAEKQLRYVRLIAAGVNNSEACRLVGIHRKTGNRWRYGRSVRNTVGEPVHYPPVKITPPKTRSPRYLSEHERIVIADLLRAGQSARGIARELGRSPSTVSREIERNSDAHGRYRPHRAEHAARVRAQKPRKRRIAGDGGQLDVRGGARRTRANADVGSRQRARPHQPITASTGTQVFFCDAHSPRQPASNENTNGLVRDNFPTGTDLSVHSPEELTRSARII
jgi:transposase